jgi:hypothetical protein
MGELVVPTKCEFDGYTKTLDGHDRHGTNQGAYRYVNKRVGAPVAWGNTEYHDEREYENCEAIHYESYKLVSVIAVREDYDQPGCIAYCKISSTV